MTENADLRSIFYPRNFLTEVIARIDLVSPISQLKEELPHNISREILKHFPILEPKPAFEQELVFSPNEIKSNKKDFIEWNFFGPNREKRLVIAPQFFFISYTKYETFKNICEEFTQLVTTFFDILKEAQPQRLGLRYINQIELPGKDPLKWGRYINKEILGLLSFKIEDAKPIRIFHNYELAFENYNLRFQFGLHNPDYPAVIKRKLFILDYDAYFQGFLEPKEIPSMVDTYHTSIQKIFEQSIADGLRGYLRKNG